MEVGETTLATEKELDELRQKIKAGMNQGQQIHGLSWGISDVEREIELVRCLPRWIVSSSRILINIDKNPHLPNIE